MTSMKLLIEWCLPKIEAALLRRLLGVSLNYGSNGWLKVVGLYASLVDVVILGSEVTVEPVTCPGL